jgi:tetratricopeptide (TPR) repeat protein
VPAQPLIRPAREISSSSTDATTQPASTNSPATVSASAASPEQRNFFQRINPINLFRHEAKKNPPADSVPQARPEVKVSDAVAAQYPGYQYHSIDKPAPGDHLAAERYFTQGVQAQQARHWTEAVRAYQQAIRLDPAYYDAQYYLGVSATAAGNLPTALLAYETALAIRPESLDARIYFAQALKQANYPIDAAVELETVLATYPKDATAHLTLGNLYAQQLHDPAKAREHYLKVLDNDPRNPRAAEIRYWLASNPP